MYSIVRRTSSALLKHTTLCNITRSIPVQCRGVNYLSFLNHNRPNTSFNLTKPYTPDYQQVRPAASGFFCKRPADMLWKSVASVSAAGRKRGRGKIKGKKVMRNLNRGQIIGVGKENIRWPGLSAPIIRGREIMQMQKLPTDEEYQKNLIKNRERVFKSKKARVSPIDRGWTGGHPGGRKIGPPDPIFDNNFEGFETVILQQKPVVHMTRKFGRQRTVSAICCTGNGNGLVGYSLAGAPEYRPALRKAKNKAAQRLMYIQRYEERTVMHNFFSRFCNTKVYVWKQAPGYGLKGHRVINSVCEMIGIKDLHSTVEGGTSVLNIVQAFLLGLLRQKSFDELSQETNLHVVEMSKENDYFPKVISSPASAIESLEETPNFDLHVFDNKVFNVKYRDPAKLKRPRTWPITLRKIESLRSHYDTQVKLMAEYGELRSFLTDKFSECRPKNPPWTRALKKAQKEKETSDA